MSQQYSPFSKAELLPHPEMLEIKKQRGELFIGIPKETHLQEKRICLTPDAVAAITNQGHRIILESGAGEGSNYTDLNRGLKFQIAHRKFLNVTSF